MNQQHNRATCGCVIKRSVQNVATLPKADLAHRDIGQVEVRDIGHRQGQEQQQRHPKHHGDAKDECPFQRTVHQQSP